MLHSAHLDPVLSRAVEKAGRIAVRDFGEIAQLQASRQGPERFALRSQRRIEALLMEELDQKADLPCKTVRDPFDGHGYYVDALHGFDNFCHALPHFALSIAAWAEGQLLASVVFSPAQQALFRAIRGQGAFLNTYRIRVSGRQRLPHSLIAIPEPLEGHEAIPTRLAAKGILVRTLGAPGLDLAYLAAGQIDAVWLPVHDPMALAAGVGLVQEAGGLVTDARQRGWQPRVSALLASNGLLHQNFLQLTQPSRPGTVVSKKSDGLQKARPEGLEPTTS